MPRIKAMEQDLSYDGPDPQIYRRYTQNTKKRLEGLVLKQGMKTSSAAKLLKVKNSSAKMILKKLRNGYAYKEKKPNQKEQEPKIENEEHENNQVDQVDVPGTLENNQQGLAFCWAYYPLFYYEIVAENNQGK